MQFGELYNKTVLEGKSLKAKEVEHLFEHFLADPSAVDELGRYLQVMASRGETSEELTGLMRVISSLMVPIELDVQDALDIGGTGGDGTGSFNISTTAALIVAATGVKVCKHGNKKISSQSGSLDMISAIGISDALLLETNNLRALYDKLGIAFLATPIFHSHPEHLVQLRKKLGIRTAFNLIGPLLNPAQVPYQVIGVSKQELIEPMSAALVDLGKSGFILAHGVQGIDEISACGTTLICEYKNGNTRNYHVNPDDFGIGSVSPEMMLGGDPHHNAEITKSILTNSCPERLNVVLPTVAMALYISGFVNNLKEGVTRGRETITSGRAAKFLDEMLEFSP